MSTILVYHSHTPYHRISGNEPYSESTGHQLICNTSGELLDRMVKEGKVTFTKVAAIQTNPGLSDPQKLCLEAVNLTQHYERGIFRRDKWYVRNAKIGVQRMFRGHACRHTHVGDVIVLASGSAWVVCRDRDEGTHDLKDFHFEEVMIDPQDHLKPLPEKERNFPPELFREGTIFEVHDMVGDRPYTWVTRGEGEETETMQVENYTAPKRVHFTSSGVVRRNGADSYVVVCKEKYEYQAAWRGSDETKAYNLSHVKRIVMPGKGMLDIKYTMYGDEAAIVEDFRRTQQEFNRFSGFSKMPSARTHYLILDPGTLMVYLRDKHMKPGPWMFDSRKASMELLLQSFFHGHRHDDMLFVCYAPKKRVDAWFKRNMNRYLINVDRLARDHADAEMDDYERDMDFDSGGWHDNNGDGSRPRRDTGPRHSGGYTPPLDDPEASDIFDLTPEENSQEQV